jgi:hypothetical protein
LRALLRLLPGLTLRLLLCPLLRLLGLALPGLALRLLLRGLALFFLFPLLCVRGSSGSEKKEQDSRADNADSFHQCTSITSRIDLHPNH